MIKDDSIRDTSDTVVLNRAQLRERRQSLDKHIAALEQDLASAQRERDAILAVEVLFPDSACSLQPSTNYTIREMALAVLLANGQPMGVRSIIDEIKVRYGAVVVRTSLSPILKKMEHRGEVRHVGDKWELDRKGDEPMQV